MAKRNITNAEIVENYWTTEIRETEQKIAALLFHLGDQPLGATERRKSIQNMIDNLEAYIAACREELSNA